MKDNSINPLNQRLGLRLTSPKEFILTHPQFSMGWLRKTIFNGKENGFDAVVIRLGRKVMLDLDRFEAWLEEHRGGESWKS